jgi:hypothetical protein
LGVHRGPVLSPSANSRQDISQLLSGFVPFFLLDFNKADINGAVAAAMFIFFVCLADPTIASPVNGKIHCWPYELMQTHLHFYPPQNAGSRLLSNYFRTTLTGGSGHIPRLV